MLRRHCFFFFPAKANTFISFHFQRRLSLIAHIWQSSWKALYGNAPFCHPINVLSQAFSINLLSLSVFACECLEKKSVPPVYVQIDHNLVSWLAEYFGCSIWMSDCMMSLFSQDFLGVPVLSHNMFSIHKSAGVSYMEKFVCFTMLLFAIPGTYCVKLWSTKLSVLYFGKESKRGRRKANLS